MLIDTLHLQRNISQLMVDIYNISESNPAKLKEKPNKDAI
jgi:hypothetical protein